MACQKGHWVALSLARRSVNDFLHAARAIPGIPFEKVIDVAALAAARQRANPRPSWCSIFTKAYGYVVAAQPALRRAYIPLPWEHFYESELTSADVVLETNLNGENELAVMSLKVPHTLPLLAFDDCIARHQRDPLAACRHLRKALLMGRLPRLLRRAGWWLALNVSGRLRTHYLSTFGVSSVGNWGVDSLRPIGAWTTLLHYGAITGEGKVPMRITFDHRVLNGSHVAHALNQMEELLHGELFHEVQALQPAELPPPAVRAA